MQLLVIQCRHQLKKLQRVCLKHRTIYSSYESPSKIPTANFPSNSAAELAPIKNTDHTVSSSMSPPEEPQKDNYGRLYPTEDTFRKKRIVNPGSPATEFGIMAGMFLRHHARVLGFRILPNGYVRASEMLTYDYFAKLNLNEFSRMVAEDPKNRFEMEYALDTVDGDLQKVWWVRAKFGHTIPGVNAATKRIIHVGKLGTVFHITRASDWERIRVHGIPQEPSDHLIHLFMRSDCHLFLDDIPVNSKVLRISIDPFKAVDMGVKFFHTNSAQLIASGNWDQTLPFEAFKEVVEHEITKEKLK